MSEIKEILKDFMVFIKNEKPETGREVEEFLLSPYFYCEIIKDSCPVVKLKNVCERDTNKEEFL